MSDSLLGLQLYSVRDDVSEDLAATLQRVVKLGISQVETFSAQADPEGYFKALNAAGLMAPSAHIRFIGESEEQQRNYFKIAYDLGCSFVIHPSSDPQLWQDQQAVEQFAQQLNESVKIAQSIGVQVGYHHHAYELQGQVAGTPSLVHFASLLSPEVALEIDIYWAAVAGYDPATLIEQLQPAVKLLHLKDSIIKADERRDARPAQYPLGQGNIDIPAAVAAAPEALRIIEFDSFDGDLWHAIEESVEYLREL